MIDAKSRLNTISATDFMALLVDAFEGARCVKTQCLTEHCEATVAHGSHCGDCVRMLRAEAERARRARKVAIKQLQIEAS